VDKERRIREVEELLHQEVSQALKDAAELAQWAEKLRADIELVEDAIELAEGGAGTN
jgi:hypothetical protein